MFEKVVHSYKIRKLQSAQRRLDKDFSKRLEAAKKANKSEEAISEMNEDWAQESLLTDDEILQLNGNYLRMEAERLFVPYPLWSKDSDKYEQSWITGKIRLTQSAQAELRKAIRQERKEAAEQVLMWVPFLSLLVAIMSVAVALAAILVR